MPGLTAITQKTTLPEPDDYKEIDPLKTCSVALMISALLASPLTFAQVYKWTDENGQLHFSSTPPPQQAIEPVDVRLNYAFTPDRD